MSTTMRAALACAAGAFVGALIALEIAGVFWWVGLLAGAMIGYLGYNPTATVRAIPIAWKAACATGKQGIVGTARFAPAFFAIASTIAGSLYLFGAVIILTSVPEVSLDTFEAIEAMVFHPMTDAIIVIMTLVVAPMAMAAIVTSTMTPPDKLWRYHFFAIYFWYIPRAFYHAALGTPVIANAVGRELVAIALGVPQIAATIGRFAVYLYREIHSDLRTMCAVDAALGASVGYFSGSPAIGAVAGLILGFINYAFVTRCVLKIIPRG